MIYSGLITVPGSDTSSSQHLGSVLAPEPFPWSSGTLAAKQHQRYSQSEPAACPGPRRQLAEGPEGCCQSLVWEVKDQVEVGTRIKLSCPS